MKHEITSSLDLFLLALIDSGLTSAYAFRELAGISVGATLPALRRLEEYGFVIRGQKQARNKQNLELTPAGTRELKIALKRILSEYQEHPPTDTQSVLRVCSLVLKENNKHSAKKLLLAAANERVKRARSMTEQQLQFDSRVNAALGYQQMSARCAAASLEAESKALLSLVGILDGKGKS